MEYIENKGIIPFLMGGLGNQLFIAVAAYVASKVKNCPLYILNNPISNNAHNLNNIDYNNSVLKYFGNHLNIDQNNSFLYFLIENGYRIDKQNDDGFSKWNPNDITIGTVLTSYYQYYPIIKPYKEEISNLILKGLNEHSNLTTLESPETTAFIHVRRGDYLNNPHIHFIQSLEYYTNALQKILEIKPEIKEIKVFSDDINWVKSCDFFSNPLFTIVDENDELKSLHIMSQCKAGAICANSTFSWWAAFLGAYSQKNPVIVPHRWISLKIECLFPDEWIIL